MKFEVSHTTRQSSVQSPAHNATSGSFKKTPDLRDAPAGPVSQARPGQRRREVKESSAPAPVLRPATLGPGPKARRPHLPAEHPNRRPHTFSHSLSPPAVPKATPQAPQLGPRLLAPPNQLGRAHISGARFAAGNSGRQECACEKPPGGQVAEAPRLAGGLGVEPPSGAESGWSSVGTVWWGRLLACFSVRSVEINTQKPHLRWSRESRRDSSGTTPPRLEIQHEKGHNLATGGEGSLSPSLETAQPMGSYYTSNSGFPPMGSLFITRSHAQLPLLFYKRVSPALFFALACGLL